MLSNVINLSGNYQIQGQTLTNQFHSLKICERKNPTKLKTSKFLILKSKDYPKGIYVSSLYERHQGIYSIEYQKIRYQISLKEASAEITVFRK